jgi:hypothetical protein
MVLHHRPEATLGGMSDQNVQIYYPDKVDTPNNSKTDDNIFFNGQNLQL